LKIAEKEGKTDLLDQRQLLRDLALVVAVLCGGEARLGLFKRGLVMTIR